MVIQKICRFISNTTSPIVSKIFPNPYADTLTLQIDGANGLYHVEGRTSAHDAWVSLAGIDLGELTAVRGGFTKAGIYELGVVGIREIRVRVERVDGEVSVSGQLISAEEA